MKLIAEIVFLALCVPLLVSSQLTCHRCYGNGYCSNGTHEDFISDERIATCNVQVNFTSDEEINNPILSNVQKAINEMSLKGFDDSNATPAETITTGHCITATVHEPHDSHTLRTCVTRTALSNNTVTLCELIESIIDPLNWYGGQFSCRACNNSHYCNEHTLSLGDGLEGDSASTIVISSLVLGCGLLMQAYNRLL